MTSDSFSSVPAQPGSSSGSRKSRPIMLILVSVLSTAVVMLVLWFEFFRPDHHPDDSLNLAAAGFSNNGPHQLGTAFKDADGDMIADAPTDPSKFVDPPTLRFCFVASNSVDKNKADWQPLADYLSKATGKPVEYVPVTSTHDELQSMREGHLDVAGFNTGAVPPAVNLSGFVPVCALPTVNGAITHSDIIVPADSPLKKPEDLKDNELTLTTPDSNSGYKAPIVLLREKYGLRPLTDYSIRCSGSHDISIAGIIDHRYQAVAVADDLLARALAAGRIQKSQYRTIFESDGFPTAGLGYVFNLKPDLAKKVHDALLSFDWKGTGLEQLLNSATTTKFVPVDYKKDWEVARKIDDQLGLLTGY